MGDRPSGLSLERKDNEGNYSPSNCKWADRSTQNNNKRGLRIFIINGVRKSLTQWARAFGLDPSLVNNRVNNGWSVRSALRIKPLRKEFH